MRSEASTEGANEERAKSKSNSNYRRFSLEKKIKKVGARTTYGSNYALMEQTIKILLESGAIRRTHKDVPLEENTNDITFIRNHNDGTYMMKAANVKAMVGR